MKLTELLISYIVRFCQSEVVLLSNLQNLVEFNKVYSRERLENADRGLTYHLLQLIKVNDTSQRKFLSVFVISQNHI